MKSTVVYVSCQLGKNCKLPFRLKNKTSNHPIDKIHCDLWDLHQIIQLKDTSIMLSLLMIILAIIILAIHGSILKKKKRFL